MPTLPIARLDPALLWRLGFRRFTQQQVDDALTEIYEALQYSVGARLAAQLNKRQRDDFERLTDGGGTEQRAIAWLEANVPNYRQIVDDEFHALERRLEGAISTALKRRDRLANGE